MTQNNIKIAITGGIGSGKSTVSEIIEGEGYKVFSCDKIYGELLGNRDFVLKIAREFDGVLRCDGSLDRAKLASKVFNNKKALKKLNSITHPEIMSKAFSKMSGESISFCEVPLLFENNIEDKFDSVIVVLREKSQRVKFVANRDKISEKDVNLRINCQFDYDNADFAKYYVIRNDGNFDDLKCKVRDVLLKIVKKN